ncbi:uncharacterized protein C8A04DRAFT_26925 [Dichotomopilus funicola]|uniref:Kinetochore protein Sos7 coiled-coil domain-containing protein n=1 Tax=Dichotomopilus funicola TaxID=1934379 RepID=A0AAN6ZQF6_9PEZI|nr:hypothetical protein C8A04DRAFT_26925 [Dichotomopilus funicola]
MPRANSPAKPADPLRNPKLLRALDDLKSSSLDDYTIIKLSEPISTADPSTSSLLTSRHSHHPNNDDLTTNTTTAPRTSDVSTASSSAPTPTTLEADLSHYRELFAKLRFSYVEQVTKEKFIRAIVGDPPLIVSPQENADLEARNAAAKAELKKLKGEVAGMVGDLEVRGRELAGRLERVRGEMEVAVHLPDTIAELEARVAALREQQKERLAAVPGSRPEMAMPLGRTRAVVEERRGELGRVERAVEVLGGQQVPRKRKEVERLRAEVGGLEKRRENSAVAAREAKRRREGAQGGMEDELEARGRWFRASEAVLRQVLDLKG